MKRRTAILLPALATAVVILPELVAPVLRAGPGATASVVIKPPVGLYVLNDAGNEAPVTSAYDSRMWSSPAYRYDITGAAIFVPIAQILTTPVTKWGTFNWDWSYVNTLVAGAVSKDKKFSIALEVGYWDGTASSATLPPDFAATCGADCAPLFHVWATGGAKHGFCLNANVPLPWVSNMQGFWKAALDALAQDLHQQGTYSSLTLVHIPGVSVYDEEMRLPSGKPKPPPSAACRGSSGPALERQWDQLGYSDHALESGFDFIAQATANAFPDKYLGLSLFPPQGTSGALAFPDDNTMTATLVADAARIAPGRLELQSDDLDPTQGTVTPQVLSDATEYHTVVGWQSNRRGGSGAACGPKSAPCGPDAPDSPYYQLLANGAHNHGVYLEVWSSDVVAYPEAFAAAVNQGLYPPAPPYPVSVYPTSTLPPPPCGSTPCRS